MPEISVDEIPNSSRRFSIIDPLRSGKLKSGNSGMRFEDRNNEDSGSGHKMSKIFELILNNLFNNS